MRIIAPHVLPLHSCFQNRDTFKSHRNKRIFSVVSSKKEFSMSFFSVPAVEAKQPTRIWNRTVASLTPAHLCAAHESDSTCKTYLSKAPSWPSKYAPCDHQALRLMKRLRTEPLEALLIRQRLRWSVSKQCKAENKLSKEDEEEYKEIKQDVEGLLWGSMRQVDPKINPDQMKKSPNAFLNGLKSAINTAGQASKLSLRWLLAFSS